MRNQFFSRNVWLRTTFSFLDEVNLTTHQKEKQEIVVNTKWGASATSLIGCKFLANNSHFTYGSTIHSNKNIANFIHS